MALYRYAAIDAYTLEELRHEYKNSDIKGRIRLFKRLQKSGYRAPYEIALLALEDSNLELRQWMARHAWLDYRDWDPNTHERIEQPERNLEDRLKHDPDPFVRACLRENPHVFGPFDIIFKWKSYFQESTHLERLALVRNPNVADELIERIFDPEDTELGIGINERSELVKAYLTNADSLRLSHHGDGYAFTEYHFSKLWELISKWPDVSTSPQGTVYYYLGAHDGTKAKVYQACDDSVLRSAILKNSTERDTDTLKLGMKDTDERCREIAFSKFDFSHFRINTKVFLETLKGTDKVALTGLAQNATLSVQRLDQVHKRLRQLKNEFDPVVDQAFETIRKLREAHLPEDPYDLFGEDGGKTNLLQAKIDFIGKKLLVMEPETKPYQRTAHKFVEARQAQWEPSRFREIVAIFDLPRLSLKRLLKWLFS